MKTPLALLIALALSPALSRAADQAIDETRPLDADATLELSNVRGLIKVTGSQRSDVRITGSIGEGAKGLIIEGDERHLRVRIDYPDSDGWGGWFGGKSVADSTLIVEVPAGIELEAEAVSANIEVDGLEGARIELESVSGDVQVRAAAKRVEVDAVSGDVALDLQGTLAVDLESVSGDLRVQGRVGEQVEVETVSGNATLSLADSALKELSGSTVSGDLTLDVGIAESGRFTFESLSGDVDLMLPKGVSANLRVESFSGDIRSDIGNVESEDEGPGSSLEATLGAGSAKVRIESFSGDVQIRTR